MPSPFYRQSSGAGSSGPGVSADVYDGAQGLFKNTKAIATAFHFLPEFDMNTSAKAAADAFLACSNGSVSAEDAFFHQGNVSGDIPQLNLVNPSDAGQLAHEPKSISQLAQSMSETGHGLDQIMSNMGHLLEHFFSGPTGFIGALIGFIAEIFTSISTNVCEMLIRIAEAAESIAQEAWKKEIEMMSSTMANGGTQSLELWNQAAATQTLAHALKNSST